MSTQAPPRVVTEVLAGGDVPLWVHPEWAEEFPWLVQGTTGAGSPDDPFDLGLAGRQPVGPALDRWRRLRAAAGARTVVHARQVHGAEIWRHRERGAPGIAVMDGFDGHITDLSGLLLAVGVADCVPVSVVDPERRAAALVHAGWRGIAAAIVERAVDVLVEEYGCAAERIRLHCGPSICGECYEVGLEVHVGVRPGCTPPGAPAPVDLRAAIAERAVGWGVAPEHVTVSAHCTRCGPGSFFSHRGGSSARQMGVLGVRSA
ncbi:MAG TPA: polyphenol oxidase family protein [Longimicrobiaceae bacterium]|nr:polyphenol oxidase family protein [Longimicrobiaceae bacterium]